MSQFRPTRFEVLPTAIKNIIIISCIFFIAQLTIQPKFGFNIEQNLALHSVFGDYYRPWQFVTSIFLSTSFLNLFFNMLGLWMLGSMLEHLWGTKKFLMFFLTCTIGGSLCFVLFDVITNYEVFKQFSSLPTHEKDNYLNDKSFVFNAISIYSCSPAIFGCFVAFTYFNPEAVFYFYFIIPMKAKWMLVISIVIQLIYLYISPNYLRGSFVANLGGALIGFILVYYWNKTNTKRFY